MSVSRAPGWYGCPSGRPQQRYWDGSGWTTQVRPSAATGASRLRTAIASPPPAATGSPLRRRMPDVSVLGTVLPLLLLAPLSVACIEPIAALLAAQLHTSRLVFEYVWLFGWVPLTIRPVQRTVGTWFFAVRRPDAGEHARLDTLWHGVLVRAGHRPDRFILSMTDDDSAPNGAAAGGHIVSVTTGALALPPRELEGILAHEFGHHLGLHPVVALMTYWLNLPIRAWMALLQAMMRVTLNLARTIRGGSRVFALVAISAALTCRLYAAVLEALLRVLDVLISLNSRQTEYLADKHAVALGYGPGLRQALERFVLDGLDTLSSASAWERLTCAHPPLRRRIERIDRLLAPPSTP
jgi:Zn-dependent protease with chaperone function